MSIATQVNKRTTISTAITSGSTTVTLTSAVFSNMTSGYLVFDYDNPTLLEVVKCSVSGATVTIITRAQDGTSAQDHAIGAKVAWNLTKSDLDAIIAGTEVGNSAYTAYTPTLTNVTLGAGSKSGAYIQIGKTVFFRVTVTLGAGGSFGGQPTFTLPVTSISYSSLAQNAVIGSGEIFDGGVADYPCDCWWLTTTTAQPVVMDSSVAIAKYANVTGSVPITFGTGDGFFVQGRYEAA